MNPSAEDAIARADALYNIRERRENVHASVELLRPFAAQHYDAAWRMGRALFFLGQEATDEQEARQHHTLAAATCARAAHNQPRRVEAHFWLGVNLALQARLTHPLRALPLVLRARRALGRAARIDAAYHAAGPLRVLARLETKLPRWLGGGHTRARAHFEDALHLAPHNTVTRLYFAETLLENGDDAGAHVQLQTLLAAPPDPAWNFETARDRQLAAHLLQKMKGKD